jgi:hypothetical protein
MEQEDAGDLKAMILELREWVMANSRRIEDLEATAFQLEGEEEILLIAVPRPPK